MRTTYRHVRMFESGTFEFLSHVHPATPFLLWVPAVVYFLWRSLSFFQEAPFTFLVLGFLGLLTWTLFEYFLHRFVFHFPAKNPLGDRIIFFLHGFHHFDPVDPTRVATSPPVALVLGLILYFSFRLILGSVAINPFFSFCVIGYLLYDYNHYAAHHFTPRTSVGKYLKQSHMIHHYVHSELHWGISSPLWDMVSGTMNEKAAKLRFTKMSVGRKI